MIFGMVVLTILSFTACKTKKGATKDNGTTSSEAALITVSGKITNMENGKDGYTATLAGDDNQKYEAVISRVNLAGNAGTEKQYKVGDSITLTGSFWTDEKKVKHITVRQIK
ncbi:MAG: hypothetical protein JWR38_4132 [Mucilaginibacter sp.]|nr:hypothetical protein [Mucilaginibacter sp.]